MAHKTNLYGQSHIYNLIDHFCRGGLKSVHFINNPQNVRENSEIRKTLKNSDKSLENLQTIKAVLGARFKHREELFCLIVYI